MEKDLYRSYRDIWAIGQAKQATRGESDTIAALEMKIDVIMRNLDGRDNKNVPLNQISAMKIFYEGLALEEP